MKSDISVYLSGYINDSVYQIPLLQSLDTNLFYNHDNISFHTSGFSSLMCYMFLIGKHELYASLILKMYNDTMITGYDISLFKTYRKISIFMNRLPFGIGKYIMSLISLFFVTINMLNGHMYKIYDFEALLEYVENDRKNNVLEKMNIHVYNLTLNKIEVVNGCHPLFKKYLLASLSRFPYFEPVNVEVLNTECCCTEDCVNCDKYRDKESDITVSKNNINCCTCDNYEHRINKYIDCDIESPFLSEINNKNYKTKNILIFIVSDCYKEKQKINIDTKTNILSNLIKLSKYRSHHTIDDVIRPICSNYDPLMTKTIIVNYINKSNDSESINNNSYQDGLKTSEIMIKSLQTIKNEKKKIYIECEK